MPSMVEISLARQSCTALAPSVIEPPPTVTMRSALASRAWLAAAITAARGVCAGIASKMPAQRAPIAWRIFAISPVSRCSVPLTIRKARCAPSRSSCSTMASAAWRPNTTSSMAPNTTRPLCTPVLPGTFCCSRQSSEGSSGRHARRSGAAGSALSPQLSAPACGSARSRCCEISGLALDDPAAAPYITERLYYRLAI